MQRTIYAFYVDAIGVDDEKMKKLESFKDDLIVVLTDFMRKTVIERKYTFSSEKKIVYLHSFAYDEVNETVDLCFKSAKYDAVRNVINTETMESKGYLKSKSDGDEEMNHVCMKFIDKCNAIALFEHNYYGIGFRRLMRYLHIVIKKYHKDKNDKLYYNIDVRNKISTDFLKALESANRIKAVTLTVDHENLAVSGMKALSGRADINKNVDIVLKPAAQGMSITSDSVKQFYKMYKDKNKKIKRISIDADRENKEPLTFDTERMKDKFTIEVDANSGTNEVNTESIFERLNYELEKY